MRFVWLNSGVEDKVCGWPVERQGEEVMVYGGLGVGRFKIVGLPGDKVIY